MKEREKILVSGLVLLLLLLWLGFPLHESERFAGSFWGGVLAVSGSALMLVPLLYLVVKRVPALKRRVIRRVPMRTLLSWHIYAGVLGPILVVAHSGHKYESAIGIVLTAMTLLVVVSGFVGRYLMTGFSTEIREKKQLRDELEGHYASLRSELSASSVIQPIARPLARLFGGFFTPVGASARLPVSRMRALAESIADVEYAIRTHESFKRWFGRWLKFHIALSVALYLLMAAHISFAVYFGLRWFD
jgi:hypothetical protein